MKNKIILFIRNNFIAILLLIVSIFGIILFYSLKQIQTALYICTFVFGFSLSSLQLIPNRKKEDVWFSDKNGFDEENFDIPISSYQKIAPSEEDKLSEYPSVRLRAYYALGFTEEAKKDRSANIRLLAYRTLGYTKEALQDESLYIREEAKKALMQ